MKTLTETAFLEWAEGAGLSLDPQYPRSAVLVFSPDPNQARFWEVPAELELRPYFLWSFLELMGEWQECSVWRHMGSWPERAESRRINDVVEWQILKGLGLPMGTADVLQFERAEADKLVTLMFSTTVFGWSVGEDLYIVPDHAQCILKTDHHNVIHVDCRDAGDIDEWVRQMDARGFPLPEDVPDATFKRPEWMDGDR
jgi:hypothetical protein